MLEAHRQATALALCIGDRAHAKESKQLRDRHILLGTWAQWTDHQDTQALQDPPKGSMYDSV